MKKIIFFSLSLILQLALIEGLATLYKNIWGDGLDLAKDLLVVDQELGWRQKPGLYREFYETTVTTDKRGLRNSSEINSSSGLKVLVLGPSSTFGWGVEGDETYSAYLEGVLEENLKHPVKVLNAGQIGFSSEQGRLLVQEDWVMDFNPDWIVLAYGVNDIDRHRFYFQSNLDDREQLQTLNSAQFIFSYLKNEILSLRIGSRYFKKILSSISCPSNIPTPKLRVSHSDFLSNIEEMARVFPSKIILLDTAHAYKTPGRDNGEIYKLAQEAADRNDCQKARKLLEKALKNESYRITRDLDVLNEGLEKQAEQLGVRFLSAHSLIGGQEKMKSFFVDPIHPSPAGHKKIAEHLSEVILNE